MINLYLVSGCARQSVEVYIFENLDLPLDLPYKKPLTEH